MIAISPPTPFVRKSGDTMTGDLNLGLNSLILHDGFKGGRLRGSPTIVNEIELRNLVNNNEGTLKVYQVKVGNEITIQAGGLIDGVDVSAINQAKVKVGTYTGNGVDDRDIDIGVDLASKSNVWVVVKGVNTLIAIHRPEVGQGDLTQLFAGIADTVNSIQGLTANGFEIGTVNEANQDTIVFRYIVFWEEP